MVDWKAAFSGKTVDEIANQLSQLPEERQQALQQALQLQGNILIAQPQPPQSWRLVILNNKSINADPRLGWLKHWPHELAHQRRSGGPGDNTLTRSYL